MMLIAAKPVQNTLHFNLHEFSDLLRAPFNVAEYSRMKFGSDRVAKIFGHEMAVALFNQFEDLFRNHRVVLIPAPSTIVPVAATLLSIHMMNKLNALTSKAGYDAVEWTMVHRNMSYNHDYHFLDRETRKKILEDDQIYFNRDYIAGKHLVFVDDVVITGAHEERLKRVMQEQGINNSCTFVSFAKYGGNDPTIEARLNHSFVRDGFGVAALSHERGFTFTTRAIRLVLETDPQLFSQLLEKAIPGFAEMAYYTAMAKGYHVVDEYADNFKQLETAMEVHV